MKTQKIVKIILLAPLIGTSYVSASPYHNEPDKIYIVTNDFLRKNEKIYKKKFIDPKGAYERAKIVYMASWKLKEKEGNILFLQLNGQCRVVNFSESDKENNGPILLDTPWCKFKSRPTVNKKDGDIFINYKITVKGNTTTEEIKASKDTGEFCSNSFGNIDYPCQ